MSTANGPAASWDEPLPEGKAHAAAQATAQAAAGREAAANAAASWDEPLPGSVSTGIGPQEAAADDVVGAVTTAMQTGYTDPGWRKAWEHADATGDNHLRSVQRGRQQAADREAGS